jgi:hypothetical protein
MLRAYARACHVSVHWLVAGDEEAMGPVGTLQEWRIRYADLVRQGVDPAEATDRISGPPAGEAEEMTDEEHRLLIGGAAAMREVLEDHSQGRWADLTEDQRSAVLEVIRSMARGNRPERAPPDDASPG